MRQQFDGFRATFAGFYATIEHQAADGDIVITHKTFRGTHVGEFLGVAPTGRDIAIGVIDVVRLADDRIIEHWNVVDIFGALAQMRCRSAHPRERRPGADLRASGPPRRQGAIV